MAEPKTRPTDVPVADFIAAVEHPRRRADGTEAQAMDRLQPHPLPRRGAGSGEQGFHAARLAGLGTAQLHHGTWINRGGKIMVEADHAVDLGPRQIQRLGNRGLGLGRDAAEGGLHVMQDRQQRPFAPFVAGKNICQVHPRDCALPAAWVKSICPNGDRKMQSRPAA